MKIAQVAPLYESIPPKFYGGTERVVSYLTEGLVDLGHDVTLFASGDSSTSAQLVGITPRSLRLDESNEDTLAPHILMLEKVFKKIDQFDIIHFHIGYLHFPLSRKYDTPNLTTLHGRLDVPDLKPLYKEFQEMPVVSISDSQRKPLPSANWQGTVYHGLPKNLHSFRENPGDYLAFLGRISPEKRVDRAIRIAKRVDMKLKIVAKVDKVDQEYFGRIIEPMLDDPRVEYLGEVDEVEKDRFLGNASALVFPIDWPEPFGLVMIEAMACGTPVVAYDRGSVREVIEEGETGFIVQDLDECVETVKRVGDLSRERCRQVFEERFSVSRMVQDYLNIYERLADRGV